MRMKESKTGDMKVMFVRISESHSKHTVLILLLDQQSHALTAEKQCVSLGDLKSHLAEFLRNSPTSPVGVEIADTPRYRPNFRSVFERMFNDLNTNFMSGLRKDTFDAQT
jgi:hypothetical protein